MSTESFCGLYAPSVNAFMFTRLFNTNPKPTSETYAAVGQLRHWRRYTGFRLCCMCANMCAWSMFYSITLYNSFERAPPPDVCAVRCQLLEPSPAPLQARSQLIDRLRKSAAWGRERTCGKSCQTKSCPCCDIACCTRFIIIIINRILSTRDLKTIVQTRPDAIWIASCSL